jgi:Transposase IS116/IS110/IS902 family
VGEFTALVILAEAGDITRFGSARKLASWAGLTPTVRGSDLKVRHGHISKQGSAWLRWVLNQAAQTAKRSPEFSATYTAIARRRGKKIATMAIARKLLTRAYHLLAEAAATPEGTTAATPQTREGVTSTGRARSSGMSRHQAALDHMTEQPGPRTHGHGTRLPYRRAAGWVLVRPLRPPRTGDNQHDPPIEKRESVLAPHDPPPLAGIQLVRPRRCAAAGADTSTLLVRVSPGERFGRLSLRGLNGDGVPRGWPWRPDAQEVAVPRGLSISTARRLPWTAAAWPPGSAFLPACGGAADEDKGRVMCWE